MNNNKSNGIDRDTILPEQSLSDLINYCRSVLKLTPEEIKIKYPDYIQHHFEYVSHNRLQENLELYFGKHGATVTCEFNKLGYCTDVYIFFDMGIEIEALKSFLQSRYRYKWFKKRWKTPECYLSILTFDDIIFLKCMGK